MLGSLILYLKGMRIMMFQLSGLYCRPLYNIKEPYSNYRGPAKTLTLNPELNSKPEPLNPKPLSTKPVSILSLNPKPLSPT